MIRAARLEADLYEEVEADTSATTQAFLVVVIVAIASGLGLLLAGRGGGGLVGGVVTAILGWLAWSFVTYFIGTRAFGGTATWGELLRTIGFAQSPGVLLVLRFIPVLGGLIGFAVFIWMLAAGVIAVRQALDVDTGKAVITVIIGWLAYVVVVAVLGLLIFGASLLGA
ncbi:MAG: YIP1 family protein [Chloroflexi bacterium]|nr:YIP1 family protein [Chloroflexota bacterium]